MTTEIFFASFLIAILFLPLIVGLLATLCFRRWGIHDYTHYTKDE